MVRRCPRARAPASPRRRGSARRPDARTTPRSSDSSTSSIVPSVSRPSGNRTVTDAVSGQRTWALVSRRSALTKKPDPDCSPHSRATVAGSPSAATSSGLSSTAGDGCHVGIGWGAGRALASQEEDRDRGDARHGREGQTHHAQTAGRPASRLLHVLAGLPDDRPAAGTSHDLRRPVTHGTRDAVGHRALAGGQGGLEDGQGGHPFAEREKGSGHLVAAAPVRQARLEHDIDEDRAAALGANPCFEVDGLPALRTGHDVLRGHEALLLDRTIPRQAGLRFYLITPGASPG